MGRFRRRGEPAPGEILDGAARTARLVDEGWLLPWGLERQVDPGAAAFVPRLAGEGITNRTGRRWTPVGPAGGPAAAVDPAGLVTPRLGGWSVDWWVGAEDRWRLPSREPAIRQGRLGSAPVVETALRIPSGDAVHRAYAIPGFVVLDVENRSPSPFALALALRPYDPLGATAIGSLEVEGAEVRVDGATALVLPAPPGRVAVSTGAAGDVADAVLAGRAASTAGAVHCPGGLASAAVLVPVAHRTSIQVLIPLAGGGWPAGGPPSTDAVVRGWEAQARTGLRAELPDQLLQHAFDAARLGLLLEGPDGSVPAEEAAVVVAALGRLGRHAEADALVRALWSRQRTDGSFDEPSGPGAPGGAHLWALGEHLRLRPDARSGPASGAGGLVPASRAGGLAAALGGGMVAAEGWLRELEAGDRLPAPAARWSAAGRRSAGAAAGEATLAAAACALPAGTSAGPMSDPRWAAPTAAALLAVTHPRPSPPAPEAGTSPPAPEAGTSPPAGRALAGPAGFDVVATLAVAAAEVAAGDARALERLAWLLDVGQPTWSWPDHVNPRTGAGSDGRGSSPLAGAAFLLVVRDLLVTEPAPGHAVLLPLLPDAWRGQPLHVRDAALSGGVRLSFAVRWHGRRPALLWEASRPVRLTAPGLDPSFTTSDARGEVLLGSPASPSAADGGTVELS